LTQIIASPDGNLTEINASRDEAYFKNLALKK